MVKQKKIIKALEKLVERCEKEGKYFSLLLLIPTSPAHTQYSLLVSGKWLDKLSPEEAIFELFGYIPSELWRDIARITPISTEDRFVQDFAENFTITPQAPKEITKFIANGYLVEDATIALSGNTQTVL
jgi:hypothetical protein